MSYSVEEDKDGVVEELSQKMYDLFAETQVKLGHNILPVWDDIKGTPEHHGWCVLGGKVAVLIDDTVSTALQAVAPDDEDSSLWKNNKVQFARLLDEMQGLGIPDETQFRQLQESMDLRRSDLEELLERARVVFECAKQDL